MFQVRFAWIGFKHPPGKTIPVDVEGGGTATVVVGSHFSASEKELGLRAICLVRKLLKNKPVYLPYWPDTYWAAITGLGADGMTYYRENIFIDRSAAPTACNFASVANFGALLAHEADHYFTDSKDNVPNDPNSRINQPVLDALNKAISEKVCGCCDGKWQLENLLGLYACQCGLPAPCKSKPFPSQ